MSEKKSQHILAIQQILAEFDIETQVKRITLQAMTVYMQGNKQAFEYIRQWESKFIEYQSRLIKAENYYKNIESNVNSKIQVTNTLNQRLEKFAQRFYNGIKQTEESVEQMRKNYMNLVRQTGNQAAGQRSLERQTKELNSKIEKLQSLLSQQTEKLTQKILQTDEQITLKNQQRRSQAQNILVKLSTAKSQIDSKSELLDELLRDIQLYKSEKISIRSQISQIYDQLNNRVQITQFSKIRLHVDSISNNCKNKIESVYEQLDGRIKQQVNRRQADKREVVTKIQNLHSLIQQQLSGVKEDIALKNQILTKSIEDLDTQIGKKLQILDNRIDENGLAIISTQQQQEEILRKIQEINNDLLIKNNHISQSQNNILSLNAVLKQIQLDNNLKSQQLAKLKVDSVAKGDIGEQVRKMTEKILAHDESIRKISQKHVSLLGKVEANNIDLLTKVEELSRKTITQIGNLDKRQKMDHKQLNEEVERNRSQTKEKMEQNYGRILKIIQDSIKQNIGTIRDKFQFLNNISKDMQVFKKTFQQQLQLNEQLNKQVKQKMDRMFGMFTKLKTDAYLKIETIAQDQIKITNKVKQTSKSLGDSWMYLSQINEIITVILAVGMWREFAEDKDSGEQYKIASLLEGWVLQATKDKSKYRGEYSSRKALMQLCLEQHVKSGDKIKGGLIQNGKQIFNRMSGGSEEYQLARRKSVSRRKDREKQRQQSELPKVYR